MITTLGQSERYENKHIIYMATRYSEYFKIPHQTMVDKGVYDAFLDKDSIFHIDPIFMKGSLIPEFKDAYSQFLAYYKQFVPLVKNCTSKEDRFFRTMINLFSMPELHNTGLGYSQSQTSGKGIRGKLSAQLANTALEIISAGMKDPEIFALLPIFEDQIGPDRISDMTLWILRRNFLSYTERISKEMGIKTQLYKFDYDVSFLVPFYSGEPIYFIPTSFLNDLPLARSFDDIDKVCDYNSKLKRKIADIIGLTWEEYQNCHKSDWKKYIIEHHECYLAIIDGYRKLIGEPYDFTEDIKREYQDIYLCELLQNNPLNLGFLQNFGPVNNVKKCTREIIRHFKHLVEDKRLSEIFYRNGYQPKEADWQQLLDSIATTYISASGIDIKVSREDNSGNGEIDFEFSKGARANTVVEIKRTSNLDLCHGYRTQLPAYIKAVNATDGLFIIIIDSDDYEDIFNQLRDVQKDMKKNGEQLYDVITIDGRRQTTASKSSYSNTHPEFSPISET